MRFYAFTHFMLSSIQQGIQTAHCVHQMFLDTRGVPRKEPMLWDWAANHRTIIVLNGGNTQDLNELYIRLRALCFDYPFSSFNEDDQSLNKSITCVGCVLPATVYDLAASLRSSTDFMEMLSWPSLPAETVELATLLNSYSLAR